MAGSGPASLCSFFAHRTAHGTNQRLCSVAVCRRVVGSSARLICVSNVSQFRRIYNFLSPCPSHFSACFLTPHFSPSLSASKPTRATPYPASACLCNKVEEVRAELLLLWLSPLGGEASGGRHSTRREAVSSTCSVCLSMEVSLVGNSSSSDLVTVDSKLPCDDALPAVRPRYVVYA